MCEILEGQVSLFDQDTWCGKTFPEPSAVTEEKTFRRSSRRSSVSQSRTAPTFLCLRRIDGQKPGASLIWTENGQLLGEFTTRSFGESPSEENASRLLQILEVSPHPKYCLSAKACLGILNRAQRRGKELPQMLKDALTAQSVSRNEPESQGGGQRTPAAAVVKSPTYCIQGNCIDRPDTSGQNGKGWNDEDVSYSLNTIDRPAVFDARGNGDGGTAPTITGDHQNRVTDYTALALEPVVLDSNQNHASAHQDGVTNALPASAGMGGGYVPMVTGPLMASGYAKNGTKEAMSGMYVAGSWDGSQVSPTLTKNNAGGGQRMPDKDNFNAVVQSINGDVSAPLDASYYKGVGSRSGIEREVVAFGLDRAAFNQGANAQYQFAVDEKKIGAQVARGPGAVGYGPIVRRLTPLECERLQGFSDGWTDVGEWVDSNGKKHKDADSPRYKALGNSIALPFWAWLARRICAQYERPMTMASLFDGI